MCGHDIEAGAVILAAGRGERMAAEINKVYLPLGDEVVIYHSLSKFIESGSVREIVVVIREEDQETFRRVQDRFDFSPIKVVEGGKRRQDSSLAGVSEIGSDYVFVHDAARPNFSSDLLDRLSEAAVENGASIPGIKPVDTIRRLEGEKAAKVLARDRLVRCQTPQCFRSGRLLEALREAVQEGDYYTDDAGAFFAFTGIKPRIVEGEYRNIKLTKPRDLDLLETYLPE